jgi:hypothetical protein
MWTNCGLSQHPLPIKTSWLLIQAMGKSWDFWRVCLHMFLIRFVYVLSLKILVMVIQSHVSLLLSQSGGRNRYKSFILQEGKLSLTREKDWRWDKKKEMANCSSRPSLGLCLSGFVKQQSCIEQKRSSLRLGLSTKYVFIYKIEEDS